MVKTLKDNKGKGIVALAGIGLGVLAYFGYKRLPQDKKDQIAASLQDAGTSIKNSYSDIEASIAKKRDELRKLTEEKSEVLSA